MKKNILLIYCLFLTACSINMTQIAAVTDTSQPLFFSTATLVPTFTVRPSSTPITPSPVPTIAPVVAELINQVNVRSSPDKKSTSLGLLNYGNRVNVIGKDTTGDWFQIIYPENSVTNGWISAAYVQLPQSQIDLLPVIKVNTSAAPTANSSVSQTVQPAVIQSTPTPLVHQAKVTKQIFLRKGPGQTYDSMGMIDAGRTVILLGRNQTNTWAQIQYETGANGTAWVAAAYLQDADFTGLPYFDNQGNKISDGSTSPVFINPGTASVTSFPLAALDGDTKDNPAGKIVFSPDGPGSLSFTSELSSPSGDGSDWISFTPYEPANQSTLVYLKLECAGNGAITTSITHKGEIVPLIKPLLCGNYDFPLKLIGGEEYIISLIADGSAGPIRFVKYTLSINSVR
ncbi:MAG: SH3 domain-containing protein [Chloroflexota bacterium]